MFWQRIQSHEDDMVWTELNHGLYN